MKKTLPFEKKRKRRMTLNLSEEDFGVIMASSDKAGLSLSEFGRRQCIGATVKSLESSQQIRELLKVNANLGRLGGLLKQSIQHTNKQAIYGLLHEIDIAIAELKTKIRAL